VFVQQMLNGLQVGFIYALIALGYTMIYGIVKLINFAHGDVFYGGGVYQFLCCFLIESSSLACSKWPGMPEGAVIVWGRCRSF
jgi:branched-subunit amino acid ABC-type transport system permease component